MVAGVQQAKRKMASEGAAAAKALSDPFMRSAKEIAAAEQRAQKESLRSYWGVVKEQEKGAKDRVRAEKAALAEMERDTKRYYREIEKESAARKKSDAQAASASKAAGNKFWGGSGGGVGAAGGQLMRGASMAIGFGARVAGDLARGAGLDLDLGSAFARQTAVESRAADLSNSSYMPGAGGANGRRIDPKTLQAEVAATATATGFDTGKAMEGLQAFVGKTGDLETGRAVFKDLAVLSKATGTNLEDMVDAAGDVSTQLGDIPNKGNVVKNVMQSIAGQGKLGAVEVRDLATQMAKIAAAAPQFTGNVANNIAVMGALAQEARQRGGAASASNAATAVQSFVNTFSKGARQRQFQAEGVETYGKDGKLRSAEDIIKDSIRKTNADPTKLYGKLFADVSSQKVVKGFASIYQDAGGGDKGMAAVSAEFDRLKAAAMGAGETADSFAAAMDTDAAKAQVLNNQFDAAAGQLKTALMPAVLDAAEVLVDFTKGLTGWWDHFTGNDQKRETAEGLAAESKAGQDRREIRNRLDEGGISGVSDEDKATLAKNKTALAKDVQAAKRELDEAKAAEGDTKDNAWGKYVKSDRLRNAEDRFRNANDEYQDTEGLQALVRNKERSAGMYGEGQATGKAWSLSDRADLGLDIGNVTAGTVSPGGVPIGPKTAEYSPPVVDHAAAAAPVVKALGTVVTAINDLKGSLPHRTDGGKDK